MKERKTWLTEAQAMNEYGVSKYKLLVSVLTKKVATKYIKGKRYLCEQDVMKLMGDTLELWGPTVDINDIPKGKKVVIREGHRIPSDVIPTLVEQGRKITIIIQ